MKLHLRRPQEIPLAEFGELLKVAAEFATASNRALVVSTDAFGLADPTIRDPFMLWRDLSGTPFNPKERVYDLIHFGADRVSGVCWAAILLWMGEATFPGRLSVWCDDESILIEASELFKRVLHQVPLDWDALHPGS